MIKKMNYCVILILMYFGLCLTISAKENEIIIDDLLFYKIKSQPLKVSDEIFLHPLDFNGDDNSDLLVFFPDNQKKYLAVWLNNSNDFDYFPSRERMKILIGGDAEDFFYSIHSKKYDELDRVLILFKENGKILSFLVDEHIFVWDKYHILNKGFPSENLSKIHHTSIANFLPPSNRKEVLVLTSRSNDFTFEIYENYFNYPLNSLNVKDSSYRLKLEKIANEVFVGHINNDEFDDIVFVLSDSWLIWLSDENEGLSSMNVENSFSVKFPDGIKSTTTMLFQAMEKYPLLIGVESTIDIDTSVIAFENRSKAEETTNIDFKNPHIIDIPINNYSFKYSYIYNYQNGINKYPLLLVGNKLDDTPSKQNMFKMFKLDQSRIYNPQLLQTFKPPPSFAGKNKNYFIHKPLIVHDINGDDISDIIFSFISKASDEVKYDELNQSIILFLGIKQKNQIPQRTWLLQE
ncbi:hypothetical protein GF373_17230 [bacterium]|nr:hypothetical protein [bacterium]